jgi:hypothetical protein
MDGICSMHGMMIHTHSFSLKAVTMECHLGNLGINGDRLYGLVVRVLGYRSGGPGSIPGTTRFSEKKENSSGSGSGSTHPREYS